MLRVTCLCFLLLALPATVSAASLYVGEVSVDEQGSRAGTAEQLRALDQVLSRLTGNYSDSLVDELGLGAGVLDTLVLSQQLVRRRVVAESGDSEERLRLQAEFDERAVNELLRDNDLARWGRERPAVLLWVVVEDQRGTRFLESARARYVIEEQARRMGLDIVLPLGDAMDLAEVSVQDVRGGFLESARASAQRYGAGVIAMLDLRLQRESGQESWWTGRWRWRVEGQDSGLNHSADDPEALIRSGLQRLASTLAARYAVIDADGEYSQWRLTVTGVVDEVQYAEVLRYLRNLSIVDELRVASARERQVTFELSSNSPNIEPYLGLGGLLELRRRDGEGRLVYGLAR